MTSGEFMMEVFSMKLLLETRRNLSDGCVLVVLNMQREIRF